MTRTQTLTAIVEQALVPLKPLLEDDSLTEIMIVADGRVSIERDGRCQFLDLRFSEGQRHSAATSIARSVDQEVSEDRPLLDARLPDGSRVAVAFPPVSIGGIAITIRKFRKMGFTLNELVESGTLTTQQNTVIVAAVVSRQSVLFSGATGSGKTTLLNTLIRGLREERLAVIEDTAELRIPETFNCIRLEAKPAIDKAPAVTMRDLVKASLRHRPDRLIVGEVRGAEAFDLLQAMNTGHGGTMSTIHAESPLGALNRFALCALQANSGLPWEALCRLIAEQVQVVVQMGRQDGRRVVQAIARPKWENGGFRVDAVEFARAAASWTSIEQAHDW